MEMQQPTYTWTSHAEQDDALYEMAIAMAADAFEHLTDDHVQCVYERLVWNANHGLGPHDAATVH